MSPTPGRPGSRQTSPGRSRTAPRQATGRLPAPEAERRGSRHLGGHHGCALAIPCACLGVRTEEGTMTATTTDLPADLRRALDRVAAALSAMFAGDPAPYAALWAPGAQPSLFGAWGPTEKGHDAVVRTFPWVASR